MTAETDLGDLNIVAIAPQPKVTIAKRKKNNKFERRRQRAQKAKAEKNRIADAPDNAEETIEQLHHKVSPASDEKKKKPVNVTESPEKTIVSKNEAESKRPNVEVEVIKPEEFDEVQTTDFSIPNNLQTTPDGGDEAEKVVVIQPEESPAQPSRRRHPNQNSKSDDKDDPDMDHANYMAEFHARPMELDRRSGARSSTFNSKDSSHLFEAKDWESLKLHDRLRNTLTTQFHLKQPTSIQSKTIHTFQKNPQQNILIHSETGSGKTLAYLLPILQNLAFSEDGSLNKKSRKELGTKVLILCPTRELASQTLDVLEIICRSNFAGWIVPGGLLGGDSRHSEKQRLRKGLAIVVATPGRLLDHLNKTESLLLNLKGKLNWLVLDEADRLLDMGLGDQVRQIVQLIRANEATKKQLWWRSVLVSATVTDSVQSLAEERMLCGDQPWVWVKGGKSQETPTNNKSDDKEETAMTNEEGYADSTPRQLAQYHITVTAKLRLSTLIAFLTQRAVKGERCVIFMGTCASVDYHYRLFSSMESLWETKTSEEDEKPGLFGDKAQVFKLHGSIAHDKRNRTLKYFADAPKSAILLTTDVSARGLNLKGIHWTVQYDPPCEIADYVHRVGRVARAGKAGHSLLFLLPSERGYLDVLEAKGITSISALALSKTLNEAASQCKDWTNAGHFKQGGGTVKEGKKTSVHSTRMGESFAAEVQRRLEDCVVQEDIDTKKKWKEQRATSKKRRKDSKPPEGELLGLARNAFMSFLRAYPTKKEPSVRSIFSARALHVGHVARSFALKEPPKALVSKHRQVKKEEAMEEGDNKPHRHKALEFNQYENNLVSLSDDEEDDNEDDDEYGATTQARSRKRVKKRDTRSDNNKSNSKNAKALLLENARKMQNNLMDMM